MLINVHFYIIFIHALAMFGNLFSIYQELHLPFSILGSLLHGTMKWDSYQGISIRNNLWGGNKKELINLLEKNDLLYLQAIITLQVETAPHSSKTLANIYNLLNLDSGNNYSFFNK